MTIELRDLDDVDPGEVRAVVEAAFGQPRAPGWWEWKHRDGPWGPSFGKVAVEGGRVLSVRMLLPWLLQAPAGPRLGCRAVDAATIPEAQGRQLFSTLNEALMADLAGSGGHFIWSTSNQRSRNAYRRLGWTWLEPIPHRWSLLAPSRRRDLVAIAPTEVLPAPSDGVHTPWPAEAWAWRVDPRCGSTYHAARLGEAAVAYRVADGRRRAIVPIAAEGDAGEVRRLLRAVGAQERARWAITVPGSAAAAAPRAGIERGSSLVAVWEPRVGGVASARWTPGHDDLERVL